MKSYEIRQSFLDYFARYDHRIVASSPVVPLDDPTLLFTNAGMVQFKNTFLGLEKRDYRRAASSQKCIRAGGKHNDLDNVGFTARHQTFFEMLGNFSFGDYFKEEAIFFAWEYVTKILGLDPECLYATVFDEDDDAERLWKKIAPELGDRVLRFGEKDNFWSMGETGPCGPCSEIHYDRGEGVPGEINGEGDRFMEIWNLVFMQFDRDDTGKMTPLPKPSVDTGAGLERFCMVMQNVDSNYSTDLFEPLILKVAGLSGIEYDEGPDGVPHRVIADHVRALAFALADNASISNEGRGYVLRRILRRAARYGHQIGLSEPFIYRIVQPLVDCMGSVFPEIKSQRGRIELVIKTEEEQFNRTLEMGITRFDDIAARVSSRGHKVVPGEDVFRLYDTYGFPADLTEIMAHEKGLEIDWAGFNRELDRQRERSKDFRQSKEIMFDLSKLRYDIGDPSKRDVTLSKFKGYDVEILSTTALILEDIEGAKILLLKETPFYAESGGQVSDKGKIYNDSLTFDVKEVIKGADNEIYHLGELVKGNLPNANAFDATAEIDHARRADIKRNHTATHLLHKALRMTLGDHVFQQGSLVAPDRFRFDFSHFQSMTEEEIEEVERIVNEKIQENLPVRWENRPFNEARKMGAMALFGEKYGDEVRVVKTGDFSIELCGGTHVEHTKDIGRFFIISESAIAAGTRRIEAISGSKAEEFFKNQNDLIGRLGEKLKISPGKADSEALVDIKNLQAQIHPRMLVREKLNYKLDDYLDKIKKLEKEKKRKDEKEISKLAAQIKPDLRITDESGNEIYGFITFTDTPQDLMVYFDLFKNQHQDDTVYAVSGISGHYAIGSPDDKIAESINKGFVKELGAKGGGKKTKRGSMPPEMANKTVEVVNKIFSK